ncbi:hypothetical protein PUMCH_002097 [Australozyma saopauloensis]|uniref:Uncharacterized protein n=1 Tax=Australozyma saopauloensis TaxID=291208 RepID=A0AAX4H894_9ASCO|nr:hypothetical protein PUMCH_002097 [[Candida] saopauloensis]
MSLDEFQLFDQRRKRKPLGDITNRSTAHKITKPSRSVPAGINIRKQNTAFLESFGEYRPRSESGKISRTTRQHALICPSSGFNKSETSIFPDAPAKEHKQAVLILLLKNVLADSSFTKSNEDRMSYFQYVHSLNDFNPLLKEHTQNIKDFADQLKLKQLRSLKAADFRKGNKKDAKPITGTVLESSPMSSFITAVRGEQFDECLLLNTTGCHSLQGRNLTLREFIIYSILGKDVRLYTEWQTDT